MNGELEGVQLILPDDAISIDDTSWQIACPLCESNCTIRITGEEDGRARLGEFTETDRGTKEIHRERETDRSSGRSHNDGLDGTWAQRSGPSGGLAWTAECGWGCDSQQIIEALDSGSSNGRTTGFEPVDAGSIPAPEAINTNGPANSEPSARSVESVVVADGLEDEIKIADELRESQGHGQAKNLSTPKDESAGRRVAHPKLPAQPTSGIPLGITHNEAALRELPPQDVYAEQSLLGSVLLDARVADWLREKGFLADYFYRESHAEIWKAMLAICEGNGHWQHEPGDEVDPQAIDVVTLSHELKTRGTLEAVGGLAYIAELAACVPTAHNGPRYADIILTMWAKRRVIEDARAIATAAYNGTTLPELADRVRQLIVPMLESNKSQGIVIEVQVESMELNSEYLSRAEIIEGLGYSQSIMLIIGGKHSGKTTNLRTLALSVARGLPIWGRQTSQGRVFYCASDDEVVSTRNELLQMGWSMDDPLNLVRMTPDSDGTKVLTTIADEAIKSGVKLIIVDMLFDWVGIKDEMSYAGTREAINQLQHLADRTGALVVASHHTPKYLNESHNAGNAALGSQGISARFSPIVLVRKWADKLYVVDSTPTRDPRGKEIKPLKIVRNEQGWIETAGEFKEWMKWEIYAQRILDVFENDKQGLSVYSIAEKVGIDRTRVQHSIKEMVDKGMLKREKQGRQYRYYLGSSNMFEREGGNWN